MSESVWFEEVDTALINYIKSVVKIPNRQGELASVPVEVRKPDNDFKVEQYPSMTIYNLYSRYNSFRQGNSDTIKGYDVDKAKILVEKSAVPYDLYYQIDFWSKNITDMNKMTCAWLSKISRCFNLDVADSGGANRNVFVIRTDALKKNDYISGNNRVFHSFITYKIQVELDENIIIEKPMVTDVDIHY